MKRPLAALTFASLLLASSLHAQLSPVGITGTGSYNNSASLIIDGVTPPEYTGWTDSTNAFWQGFDTSFTIDLGAKFKLTGISWSVDNNDSYTLETSLNGTSFNNLFTVTPSDGNVTWGMDTMTSFLGSDFVAAMAFAPVDARYLRVAAVPGGDTLNAIGEVTAYGRVVGTAVPEPSTYGLFGAFALVGLAFWRRSRRA